MATRSDIVKAQTEQEKEQVFTRLLLAHGRPPNPLRRIECEQWEDAVYDSVRAMLPKADAEMVMWHYTCWLSKERRDAIHK